MREWRLWQIPLQLTKTYGPQNITNFNLYNSISVNGTPASGYRSGDALKAVQETAEKLLPANYAYEFGGISREESRDENLIIWLFVFPCIYYGVDIFDIVCALREFAHSLFVVLSVARQ